MPHDDVLTQADRFVAAVNAGNWNEVAALFATTIYHAESGTGMATSGATSALWFWQRLKQACPDWHGTIGWSVTEGEYVVQEVVWAGTHTGALRTRWGTLAPSNRAIRIIATLWYRFSGNLIQETHHHLDFLALLEQLGSFDGLRQPPIREQEYIMTTLAPIEAGVMELRANFTGHLLTPADPGYDQARAVWNAMIDRRPRLIARCAGAADVVQAVEFARTHDLVVSVRGGGHNVAGNAVCDDGLMIDLSLMKGIVVDADARTAQVEPGVLWSELDQATQQYGLATTGGTVSHTGVAGLTLGGGLGWLMAQHGAASDNLLSANLVLADGRQVTASADENADLFWAIRGGGGNFGIATRFVFQLHPVGPTVLGGMVLYPLDQAADVLRFYRDFSAACPDELTVFAGIFSTPEGLPVVALIPGWFGEHEAGQKALEPLRSFGTPLVDMVGPIPYTQLQAMFDAAAGPGLPRYWKSGYFTDLDDALIEQIVDHASRRTSPMSLVLLFHMHGAVTRVPSGAIAFTHRRNQWDFDIIAQWTEPNSAPEHIGWVRTFWQAVAPRSNGVYVNHIDGDDGVARVRAAYGDHYERLAQVKAIYDPTNFFRMNNNIKPQL